MRIGYYPGCTLKSKAKNLEDSALASLRALDIKVEELERWNCCGAVFSLADDDLIHHLAPVRDLIRAKDQGFERVITLCSLCYNTLARANLLMREDEEKRKTINLFMEEETDYHGEVKVQHYLDFLRTDVTWNKLKAKVKKPLKGLRVAPYYGCTLLRPREIAIEPPDTPQMFGDFLRSIGAEVVDFQEATSCCSSYQILANESAALEASAKIIHAANQQKVDAIAMTCPVCEYNLGRRQKDILKTHADNKEVPTFYFTQLLAIALDVNAEELRLQYNMTSSKELLRRFELIG